MKQTTALNILKSGKNVFITGSAGTGKTYLLNLYTQYLKEHRVYPTIVAPTGIAASHLGGQTIHSFFALGIRESIDEGYVESLMEKKYLKTRFSKLKLLIIDEISMVSPALFSSMDLVLRGFKGLDAPFGGVQVVISGDFFQLPPVSKEPKDKRFAWQSPSWKALELQTCYLEEKFRQDDNRLIEVLDDIRSGDISDKTNKALKARMDVNLSSESKITQLYTHNADVDRINLAELDKLEGEEKLFVYESKGSAKNIDKIFKSSLVLEELRLKKGALVIFIKNSPEGEYVNGTTGIVQSFSPIDKMPIVITTDGKKIKLEREEWSLENDSGKVTVTVTQVPLRLAWAITIHKSQGMTLDAAQIDLSKTFEVGQGYVALSRIKSIEGLSLLGLNPMALRVDPLILHIDDRIKMAS
ncbi:MAG: helicase, partial [Sulfurovum sp.]